LAHHKLRAGSNVDKLLKALAPQSKTEDSCQPEMSPVGQAEVSTAERIVVQPISAMESAQAELDMILMQAKQLRITIARRKQVRGASPTDASVSDVCAHYESVLKDLESQAAVLTSTIDTMRRCDADASPASMPEPEALSQNRTSVHRF